MYIDLNKITDFFKPNRQVWQEAEPGGDVDTDTDVDSDTDYETVPKSAEEISDFEQVMEIAKQAKDECKTAKKAICSLQKDEVWDAGEMNRLRKFIDELDDKFLVKAEGEEKLNYTADRLKRLEDQLNMELLISEFLKSVKADITTYPDWQTDKYPNLNDHIVFKYKDGTRKILSLEMSSGGLPVLESDYGEEEEHAESETETIGDRVSEYQSKITDMIKDKREENLSKTEELIERARHLNTPDAAFSELIPTALNLPPSFLKDISEPLSEYADIISNSEIIDGDLKILPEDKESGREIQKEIKSILANHFGENFVDNMSSEEYEDLGMIAETFGLD